MGKISGLKAWSLALGLLVYQPAWCIVSSNSGTTVTNGYSINEFVGADRFYAEGYTGTRATIINVEGGHIWDAPAALSHVQTFLDARYIYQGNGLNAGALGEYDRHAAWVGAIIGGRGTEVYQQGIAYGADLWSGAVATDWYGAAPTNLWGWSRGYAFTEPYAAALLRGVNGRKADVANSSWGAADDKVGGNVFSLAMDGIAKASARTIVFSSMNNGPAGNSIGYPQSGYNTIVVGALGNDLDGYRTIADFSSRSPSDYAGPDGAVPGVRARVDIVAPGQNITSPAYYGGVGGGNRTGVDSSGGATDWISWNLQGTSFSAPIVAAGATLLNDVAYDRFSANEHSHDGQVIKAVLLNSARKTDRWDNGQYVDATGVIRTSQALDYTYGAGVLDLDQAFDQFTAGTTDLPGLTPSGQVDKLGWDYGVIDQWGDADYTFDQVLMQGSSMTATLNWFVGRSWQGNESGGAILTSDDYFTNLSLQLFLLDDTQGDMLMAESDADYLNTEHLSLSIGQTGRYKLRVHWVGERYDLTGNDAQTYALAWANVPSAVPEPSAWMLVFGGLVVLVARQRRRA
jgi:Subtilase family